MTSPSDLLSSLQNLEASSRSLIRTLPGGGERAALQQFIAESAARGPVLVLASSRLLLEQWARRLEPLLAEPALIITSASDALQFEERDSPSSTRVILTLLQRAQGGPVMNLLKGIELELVVVDGPISFEGGDGSPTSALERAMTIISARARKTLIVVPGTAPFNWAKADALNDFTPEDFRRVTANVEVVDVAFDPTAIDLEVQARAENLLKQYGDLEATPASLSKSELHALLLSLLTRASSTKMLPSELPGAEVAIKGEDAESAWRLVEELEESPDPRLAALDQIIDAPETVEHSWLITATLIRDVAYIADHLMHSGRGSVKTLSSVTAPQDRESALDFSVPGQIVVAGRIAYTLMDSWPAGCSAVWWSPPSSRAEFEARMSLLATGERVKVYQLIPQRLPG